MYFFLRLVCVFGLAASLTGCADFVSKKFQFSPDDNTGIAALSVVCGAFSGYVKFDARERGRAESFLSGPTFTRVQCVPFGARTKPELALTKLSPGEYTLTSWHGFGGNMQYYPGKDFRRYHFQVEKDKVTYLGRYIMISQDIHHIYTKLIDAWSKDKKLFHARLPLIKASQIRKSIATHYI